MMHAFTLLRTVHDVLKARDNHVMQVSHIRFSYSKKEKVVMLCMRPYYLDALHFMSISHVLCKLCT